MNFQDDAHFKHCLTILVSLLPQCCHYRDSVNYLRPLCGLKNETISNSYIATYLHRDSNSYMQEQAHHTQGQTRSIFKGCMNLSFWNPRTGYWKPQCLVHTEVHDKYRQNDWMNKEGISRVWLTAAVTLLLGVTLYAVELDWNTKESVNPQTSELGRWQITNSLGAESWFLLILLKLMSPMTFESWSTNFFN